MDIRNIQSFIRVTELGSITKAAEELGYVQSAVSLQIQQLEKELGFLLFDRIGKKVSLTALGSEFLENAYRIVHSMQDAINLGKDITEIHGTLRIGVLESLLFGNMLPFLPEFKKAYKNMNLQIKMGQTSELLRQLKQNQSDVVYLSAEMNTDPDLRCYYKRQEEIIFVSSPNHSMAKHKKVGIKELFENDFIVTESSGICFGRLQKLAQQNNTELHASIEVDSTIAIASLLKSTNALAFLPEYSVKKQLKSGELVQIDACLEPQVYYSQILAHKNRWISPFIAELIKEIKIAYPEN